jgi:uncharacterized protein YkwD
MGGCRVLYCLGITILSLPIGTASYAIGPTQNADQQARLAGRRSQQPRVQDPSLNEIAMSFGRETLRSGLRASPWWLEGYFRKKGLVDPVRVPFLASGPTCDRAAAALGEFLRQRNSDPFTHYGLAWIPSGDDCTLAAVFVRRSIQFDPIGSSLPLPVLSLTGISPRETPLEALLLGPCEGTPVRCPTESQTVPIRRSGKHFTIASRLAHPDSLYILEVVAQGPYGPEIAAFWSTHELETVSTESNNPRPAHANPEEAALTLLNHSRRLHGLGPLHLSAALAKAARDHAERVCQTGFASHLGSRGTSPVDRAGYVGIFRELGENVVVDTSVPAAHRQLLLSPAHRRNMLDRDTRQAGVGVSVASGPRKRTCMVQLFAR